MRRRTDNTMAKRKWTKGQTTPSQKEGQTTPWPKENGQKDKKITKHTKKTKDHKSH